MNFLAICGNDCMVLNHSIILKIIYDNVTVLFTGDIEDGFEAYSEIMQNPKRNKELKNLISCLDIEVFLRLLV